jgi:S1-C subfamily serine protease
MKRILAWTLSVVVLLGCPFYAYAADRGSLHYFTKQLSYQAGQFSDVSTTVWYAESVQTAYELGLMQGVSQGKFNTSGNITLAETIALADRLHSTYYQDGTEFEQGQVWYQVYVDYAFDNGILMTEYSDYTRAATRADFAKILAAALPETALQAINTIEDGAIPDVSMSASYAASVYELYRAGVLTGNDSKGTFAPNSYIDRASVAAIVSRMADTSLRKTLSLTSSSTNTASSGSGALDAEDIYAKCAPAVVYVSIYNQAGTLIQTGSGFFIDSNGTLVTNYHVIDGGYSAKITTTDNQTYSVSGVYSYDEDRDLAILKVNGSGFSYLEMDTADLKAGADIYTIGSPLGLSNTISTGIISNTSRTIDDMDYIQLTAPISSGSSGGALINKNGKVIGVVCGAVTAESGISQNLNLAIPIHYVKEMSRSSVTSLAAIAGSANSSSQTGSKLTASQSQVQISVGKSATIQITDTSAQQGTYLTCSVADPSIAKITWGKWQDSTIPLTIQGVKAGSTTITIYDESRTDSKGQLTVQVTVTGSSASTGSGTTTTTGDTYVNGAPTYQSLTGTTCKSTYYADTNQTLSGYHADGDVFAYRYSSASVLANYLQNLNAAGWQTYNTEKTRDSITYYLNKGMQTIGVSYQAAYQEVWIFI